MSRYEFKLPDIGEGVTEGEIVKWLVAKGDVVKEDQPMVEVMTDKATVTITSPKSGTIVELGGDVGKVVAVHSTLVVFDLGHVGGAEAPPNPPSESGASKHASDPAARKPEAAAEPLQAKKEPAATAVGDIKEDLPGMALFAQPAKKNGAHANGNGAQPQQGYFNEKPLATPATRQLARELGVDLRTVPPSGPRGRVTKDDVSNLQGGAMPRGLHMHEQIAHAQAVREDGPRIPSLAPSAAAESIAPPPQARTPHKIATPSTQDRSLEERTPLRGVRKRIFEGMARSKHTAAHFTFVEECDATALMSLRDRMRPQAEKSGVKLTFLPFFVKAVVAALKRHPTLNSAFDESTNEIVTRKYFHIGIASSTEQGLVVPVVRDCDRKSILDIAKDIARLAEDTKSGKTRPEDLGNSTFTITSLGAQGGLFATPILNFPEVGILGIHRIKERPVVKDGQIVIGNVMLLSLSFDHRIIDGHVGAAFAYELIGYLENPDRLFLEMA